MIRSAILIESEIAATNLGEGGPPFQSASRRAARIDAAISSTRLRPSSMLARIAYSLYLRLAANSDCEAVSIRTEPSRKDVRAANALTSSPKRTGRERSELFLFGSWQSKAPPTGGRLGRVTTPRAWRTTLSQEIDASGISIDTQLVSRTRMRKRPS